MTKPFLLEPKVANPEHLKFNVKKPTKLNWILLAFYILISFGYWSVVFQGSTLIIFALVVMISMISWKRLGNFFLSKFVYGNFVDYLKEREGNFQRYQGTLGKIYKYSLMFFGIYLDPHKNYFIEEEVPDVDMTKLREIYKDRIVDLLSACLGITVLLASILKNLLVRSDLTAVEATNIFLGFSFLAMIVSPTLVGWLIPVIWTLQDSAIREITKRNTVREVSNNVRNGPVSRLLGFAGFIGGLTLLMDVFPLMGIEVNLVLSFLTALIFLALSLPIILGPAYFIGLLYFTRNHEKNVNRLRFSLFEKGVPLGMTMVRRANNEEVQRFNEIGKEILGKVANYNQQIE